jgi:hypothetical protein
MVTARLCALALLVAGQLRAQAPWEWRAWNAENPNILVGGLGANAGLAGLRYARTVGDTPFSLGLGVSSEGYAPYLEVTPSDGFASSYHVYGGIGALFDWRKGRQAAPFLELGGRWSWGRSRHLFGELGLALIQFRDSPWLVIPLLHPHVQAGIAF